MEGNIGPIAARLDANVRVVRGGVLGPGTVNTSTQSDVYAAIPTATNGKVLGVASEDLLETGFKFDATVAPETVIGTTPASPYNLQGKRVGLVRKGRFPCIAASAISLGDVVNIADAFGRVKTVSEAVGTLINAVGIALTPANTADDIVEVDVAPYVYKA